jgi:hypothetical protein
MNNKSFRDVLIKNGIKNLKVFGYPGVNDKNILTDMVYSMCFENMLRDNIGKSKEADIEIKTLLNEIDINLKKKK